MRPRAVFRSVRGLRTVQPTAQRRTLATPIRIPIATPAFPTIQSCPPPTCSCRSAPSGLDIDWDQNINGSMAAYAEQVLICTGESDWPSRIETDTNAVLVKSLKAHLGPRGKYSNPYHNVMITNSSLAPATKANTRKDDMTSNELLPKAAGISDNDGQPTPLRTPYSTTSAYLLPSFRYVPAIPNDDSSIENFLKAFVLPEKLHAHHNNLPQAQKDALTRQHELQKSFVGTREVDEVLVLICGHGQRDERCGKLGPILKDEFENQLRRQTMSQDESPTVDKFKRTSAPDRLPRVQVGLISHIGGHKFAGNVIIYIPPSFSSSSLAGKGIWYGRVMPEDVEGIVSQTILGGQVIEDKFRGGIDQQSGLLRL